MKALITLFLILFLFSACGYYPYGKGASFLQLPSQARQVYGSGYGDQCTKVDDMMDFNFKCMIREFNKISCSYLMSFKYKTKGEMQNALMSELMPPCFKEVAAEFPEYNRTHWLSQQEQQLFMGCFKGYILSKGKKMGENFLAKLESCN